ncbi:hypothetical protein AK812_SmicGene41120 [Symbiodinium microadriaticum]|uniref:Uncharacterized protein n=1 Tax=Symbiodinium microadriaticum TaxID=2951 RepID=A0A1Q9C6Y3_SYMMI|nr:hypothetical protein AK812_SmicGene41120 [Symbiodinium microadriaticum]
MIKACPLARALPCAGDVGSKRIEASQPNLYCLYEEDPSPSLALRDGRCAVASTWAALLFDAQSSGKEIASYQVTCVRFHPARPSLLVTGGDDGLLCVLDTTQRTEEETLRLALNVEVRAFVRICNAFYDDADDDDDDDEDAAAADDDDEGKAATCAKAAEAVQLLHDRGNLLDVLYSDESGRAYVLAGSVEGKLLVQPGCGHTGLVRASVAVGPHFVTGGHHASPVAKRKRGG